MFILFGVYGNVVRVKILFNKKDNALLQMSDIQQSETAMNYLKDKIVHGKPLRIIRSKHQHVQMPKEGQEAANLTQDYTNSPLHRFKKPGSKNFQVCSLINTFFFNFSLQPTFSYFPKKLLKKIEDYSQSTKV